MKRVFPLITLLTLLLSSIPACESEGGGTYDPNATGATGATVNTTGPQSADATTADAGNTAADTQTVDPIQDTVVPTQDGGTSVPDPEDSGTTPAQDTGSPQDSGPVVGADFGESCDNDLACISGLCIPFTGEGLCTKTCEDDCPPGWNCELYSGGGGAQYMCVPSTDAPCMPSCGGKECGADGCGGSCGDCQADENCENGQCECVGSCVGKECGDDGCGGSCGTCEEDETCGGNFQCTSSCAPDCADKNCGPDGCGGLCGECPEGQTCEEETGSCQAQQDDSGCCEGSCPTDTLCHQKVCSLDNYCCNGWDSSCTSCAASGEGYNGVCNGEMSTEFCSCYSGES